MTIIGVSALNYMIDNKNNMRLPYSYIDSIKEAKGIPFGIPILDDDAITETIKSIDGLVIPGGDDIDPSLYHEVIKPYSNGIDKALDHFQLKLIYEALKQDKPILAICRGIQILNVAFGGTIYQDLSEYPKKHLIHDQLKHGFNYYDKVHEVYFKKDSILEVLYGEKMFVNSFHHQMIHKLGKELTVIGQTKDGIIEAIVNSNYRFVLGVQWHPERSFDQLPLFRKFIEVCKLRS